MDGEPPSDNSMTQIVIIAIICVILIILSMLFSISESSFLGVNKLRLHVLKKNKDKKAIRCSKLLEKKEQLINTMLVSNDIVNILLSSLLTSLALSIFGEKGVSIATFTATILLLLFGEITPKNISTRAPDKIAFSLSGFVNFTVKLMSPVIFFVTRFSRFILKILKIESNDESETYSEEEIKTFFDLSSESGLLEEDENRMMNMVFKFSDLEAQDIMIPRTKIKAVSQNSSYRDIVELSQRLGFTRFPVYRNSIDDIVGIIYLKDMIPYKNRQKEFNLCSVMHQPLFILGTKKMSSVQEMLFENRQSMAVVVDEYSGTDGIITEKDISREIFALPGDNSLRGKIFDFNNVENQNDFEINGLVLIRDLREALHIPLKSEMNETIGGWFTEKLNRMAENKDCLTFEDWTFTVKKIQSHRIERIQIKKINANEDKNE